MELLPIGGFACGTSISGTGARNLYVAHTNVGFFVDAVVFCRKSMQIIQQNI
jgi:hypothetical protein